jgi:hypothetical protein
MKPAVITAALFVALVAPAAVQSRLVVLDRPHNFRDAVSRSGMAAASPPGEKATARQDQAGEASTGDGERASTLACSDEQALETALTLARLHDGPAFRDHARSYGCMWISVRSCRQLFSLRQQARCSRSVAGERAVG